jgi:hypothetical protein
MTRTKRLAIALICALAAANCAAGDGGGPEFSGSGFLTIAAGKMLGGARGDIGGYNCPCYVSDYAQAAIYDGRKAWQLGPDSKLGLQGSAYFDDSRFSVTAQVVSRGAANGAVDLEWLYGSYKVNEKLTLQLGRQRLPMFYYSDSQDIGFALPWTHLPTWLYGWQIVNYNGGKLMYQDNFGDWTANANVFTGSEHHRDSGYWKVYGNGAQSVTDVNWTHIVGGDLTLNRDWFETRFVYIQSDTQDQPVSNAWDFTALSYSIPPVPAPVAKQKIYGVTLKADYQDWVAYYELINIKHPGLTYMDYSQNAAIGYRYGRWLPMLTWGEYWGKVVTQGVLPNAPASVANGQQTYSLSIRYDLNVTSDLKMQYDVTSDHSDPGFNPRYGSSHLLTLAYDMVF